MRVLPVALMLLHIAHICSAKCDLLNLTSRILDFEVVSPNMQCVNASNKNITTIKGKPPQIIMKLDLSHNKLQELPQEFLDNLPHLQELYLNDNELKQFPSKFSSKSLRLLRLEGNNLASLSTDDFPKSLTNLSMDCQCELMNNALFHCAHNCTPNIECLKPSDTRLSNAEEYYAQSCNAPSTKTKYISIAIVISIFVVFIAASVAYVLIRKMKMGAMFGQDKRMSCASDATQGQPRYLTHSGPQELGIGHQGNYENVFIDKPQEARGGSDDHRGQRQSKNRLPSSIEKANNSLTEQPIYANTQDVYYNFPGKTASEPVDEEVYIMPDH